MALVIGMLMASTAYAGTKASLELDNPASVNGQTLKAGEYQVEWSGSGPAVEVSIKRGKRVLAKVPARVIELQEPAGNDALTWKNASGPNMLTGFQFRGKRMRLELTEARGDANRSSQ